MKYARLVIGYHGCTQEVAERLLAGNAALKASTNNWDWLGHGIYFWEFGQHRALDWARSRSDQPAVIGGIIQLNHCLDLLDTDHTKLLAGFAADLVKTGVDVPLNRGGRRNGDCYTINQLCEALAVGGTPIDSVRASFHEGDEVFPGSALRLENHIQLVVRNPATILGFFKPH